MSGSAIDYLVIDFGRIFTRLRIIERVVPVPLPMGVEANQLRIRLP